MTEIFDFFRVSFENGQPIGVYVIHICSNLQFNMFILHFKKSLYPTTYFETDVLGLCLAILIVWSDMILVHCVNDSKMCFCTNYGGQLLKLCLRSLVKRIIALDGHYCFKYYLDFILSLWLCPETWFWVSTLSAVYCVGFWPTFSMDVFPIN